MISFTGCLPFCTLFTLVTDRHGVSRKSWKISRYFCRFRLFGGCFLGDPGSFRTVFLDHSSCAPSAFGGRFLQLLVPREKSVHKLPWKKHRHFCPSQRNKERNEMKWIVCGLNKLGAFVDGFQGVQPPPSGVLTDFHLCAVVLPVPSLWITPFRAR